MAWFNSPKPDPQLLREGARLLKEIESKEASVWSLKVFLRMRLLAAGHNAEAVERVIDWLLQP